MSTLTGNKISLTYKSLIKVSDNDILTATLQQLSDGLGNNSGVYLNTGGDLKSTGTLEFANFKGTSTSVTINKLVNQADGISSNDNDTSLPTSAAVKDYVDTHVTSQDLDFSDGTTQSAIDLDSQVFSIVGTTNEIDTVASGQQLQIGLPNSITISGTYTGATFSGDLNGTINTATTAVTQAAGNNSTKVATTAYVDTLDAASDLDFSGTSGTGDVNLNTQTFAITGAANQITTAASNQGLVISLLSSGVTLPNNSVATTQSAGDNSTKVATTAYVDVLDAASDLDIAGDSGTGDVNLNTQTFTLSGTTNQVTTAVSGQSATFSLPSTVHRNLQGNVTGNLTGNADTATKWATARNLSLTSEATGTISSVDGTQNVSGAVTLLNSAVTGKVLTGLPTPAAGNIQAGDSILEAFGKLQSQVSSISNGLIFKGSWDADTNTPTLTSGGGEVDSGTTTGQATNKLIQSGQNFNTTITVGDKVINQVDGTTALVTVIDSNTQLSLNADIMLSGEAYTIDASPFIQQGNYYVVNYAGTTNLNGNNSWSIGDWVIADADNRWSKLDHSQVDGQGTIGNLPVFATATTIGDSIVAQSGTALTVTGSLNTTLGASVAGDFAVNTNKFTVNATSGNTLVAGDVGIGVAATKALQVSGEALFGNGTNGLLFSYSGGNSSGIIDTGHNSTALEFRVGNTQELLINGTSATFTGSVNITGGTTNGLNITTSGTQDTIKIDRAATSDNAITKYQTASADKWIVGLRNTGDDNFRFYNYGTSSDSLVIDTSGTIIGTGTYSGGGSVKIFEAQRSGGAVKSDWDYHDSSPIRMSIGTSTSHSFAIKTANTPRLTIDSSGNSTFAGNVGIGITPNASYSGVDVLQLGKGMTLMGNTNDDRAAMMANLYLDSNTAFRYVMDGLAGKVAIEDGIITFGTAPSGTAGAVATVTERMRIDSSGLTTIKRTGITGVAKADMILQIGYEGNNGQNNLIGFGYNGGTNIPAYIGYTTTSGGGSTQGDLVFATRGVTTDTAPTERMRIDNSGNVKVGRSSGYGNSRIQSFIDSTANFATPAYLAADSTNMAQGVGGEISFIGKYATGVDDYAFYGGIKGFKENATSGNTACALGFYTRPTATLPTERMRIDSSGRVGIGTDNPARNLTIYESSGNAVLQLANSTSGVGASDGFLVFTDGTNVGLENKENGYLSLSTQAIERMRVSADGKVTIGNTAAVQPLTVAGNVLFRTSTADGFENRFQFIPGGSGDAGNFYVYNASETATIRLNANGDSYFNGGNVGIGGSSTGAKLEIIGGGYNSIRIGSNQTANTNKQSGISMNNYEGNGTSIFQTFQQNNDNSIYWGSGDAGFRGVQNHYFMVNADSDATTNHITAMRITSGGLLFVGDTTTNYGYSAHHIANDASQGYALILRNSNTSTTNNSVLQLNQAETTSTTQGYLIIGRQGDPNSGTNRFFVYSNGDVKNQNNSYGAISDERLKENIVDATPKLDDLMKVKIRNYNFIGQEDKQIGVIAQEIENVFPNLVEDTKDPENEENTKSVKYSVLVPIMLKAIQELKAEVDLLKQECKCK